MNEMRRLEDKFEEHLEYIQDYTKWGEDCKGVIGWGAIGAVGYALGYWGMVPQTLLAGSLGCSIYNEVKEQEEKDEPESLTSILNDHGEIGTALVYGLLMGIHVAGHAGYKQLRKLAHKIYVSDKTKQQILNDKDACVDYFTSLPKEVQEENIEEVLQMLAEDKEYFRFAIERWPVELTKPHAEFVGKQYAASRSSTDDIKKVPLELYLEMAPHFYMAKIKYGNLDIRKFKYLPSKRTKFAEMLSEPLRNDPWACLHAVEAIGYDCDELLPAILEGILKDPKACVQTVKEWDVRYIFTENKRLLEEKICEDPLVALEAMILWERRTNKSQPRLEEAIATDDNASFLALLVDSKFPKEGKAADVYEQYKEFFENIPSQSSDRENFFQRVLRGEHYETAVKLKLDKLKDLFTLFYNCYLEGEEIDKFSDELHAAIGEGTLDEWMECIHAQLTDNSDAKGGGNYRVVA